MTANKANQLRQQNSNLTKRYLNTGEAASYTGIPAATFPPVRARLQGA